MKEIDRILAQKELAKDRKILYSLDKHSEMSNTEFAKRIDEQASELYNELIERELLQSLFEQSQEVKINYNLSSVEKELTNLFAELGNKR